MNRAIPVRDDVIYLGNDISVDASAGAPVQDAPPLEINDTPPSEPRPWIAPQQPTKRDDLNDGSADA